MKNLLFSVTLSFSFLCYTSNSCCAVTKPVIKGNSHPTHVSLNGKGVSKILTTKGYKPIQTVNAGDSVVAYINGGEIVNAVLSVENITPTDRLFYLINGVSMSGTKSLTINGHHKKLVQNLAIGDIFYSQNNPVKVVTKSLDTANSVYANKDFYLINNKWNLFSEQSIWVNNNVTHAKLLQVGDTIYDDGDAPIVITSVVKNMNLTSWYRFSISGDHSYIVNGLTLHNASRYGSTTGGNSNSTSAWSGSSSGTPNGASVPTSSDDVFLNSHSANLTINAALNINSFYCGGFQGGYSGTLTLAAGVTVKVFADFTLNTMFDGFSGMVFVLGNPVSSTLEFAGGGTQNITTAGQTLGTVIFDGYGGTVNLMDNINCSGRISLDGNGGYTFNTNGKNIRTPYFDGQGNDMTVNLGASVITCTGNDSNFPYWQTTFRLVNWQEDPVVTVNRGTSKIIFTDASSNSKTFNSPFTLYDLQFTGGGSGTYQLYALHLHQLTDNAATTAHSLLFYGGGITTTFDLIPLLTGSAGHVITIGTYSGYTYGTLSCASGTFTGDYLNINKSHATGGATWNAGAHSTDGGGNTGWIFSVSASAGANKTICTGSSATIGGTPTASGGVPPYTYSWSPSTGLNSVTVANPVASPSATTTYTVSVTGNTGPVTSTVKVTVSHPIVNGDSALVSILTGGIPSATGGIAPYTFAWHPDSSLINPLPFLNTTTTFTLTVTDAIGCSSSDTARFIPSSNAGACGDIFISEYLQDISHANDAIELYNPTAGTINLNGYYLGENKSPFLIKLTGNIAAHKTFVIANTHADTSLTHKANMLADSLNFNGKDVVTLAYIRTNPRGILFNAIDQIGDFFTFPNDSGWAVGPGSTTNHTLMRGVNVTKGNPNWATCQNEWTVYPRGTFSYLGTYKNICAPADVMQVTPTFSCTVSSYTTTASASWFSFVASSPYIQITEVSPPIDSTTNNVHIHELTLYSGSSILEDENLPMIQGAQELEIDASGLTVGATYYVKASRSPGGKGCPGVTTPGAVCGGGSPVTFTLCVRYLNVIIPKDFTSEPPSISHTCYQNKGQIVDVNNTPRFDITGYTNNVNPAVYNVDTVTSFVFSHVDTTVATPDTLQRVDMFLVGGSNKNSTFKTEKISGYLNYFLGHVPTGATHIKGYSRTVKNDIYPNIDMQTYSNNSGIKFYFIIRPPQASKNESVTANSANVVLEFKGANSVSVTPGGGLKITTSLGILDFEAPHAYQLSSSNQIVPVTGASFVQLSATKVTFNNITNYVQTKPLFIQVDRGHKPSSSNQTWSSYYGGNGSDGFKDVKTDDYGNIYVTGYGGASFPTTAGVVQSNIITSSDAVIVKFNADGSRAWATYYGGKFNETANSIAADIFGNVYVTGYTTSPDFVTYNQGSSFIQPLLNGIPVQDPSLPLPPSDAFIVKLSPGGDTRMWATFYGGNNAQEEGYDLALDNNSSTLYVVGGHKTYLATPTIPTFTKAGAYNSTVGTGWILQFDQQTGARLWSTRIGGPPSVANNNTSATMLLSCFVPAQQVNPNSLYVCGKATESGYPMLKAGGSSSFNTGNTFDAVATKFNPNGSIDWSTYYGGSGDDIANGIAADQYDNAFITGSTTSSNSDPIQLTNPGGTAYYDGTYNGNFNSFIAEFAWNGTRQWGTYFGTGTSPTDGAINISVDKSENLTIVGQITDNGLPLPATNPANTYFQGTPAGLKDGFIAFFNFGNVYKWGTYLGGTGNDKCNSVATFSNSALYVVGETYSFDFPTFQSGASWYQGSNGGGQFPSDGFISAFDIFALTSVNYYGDSDNRIIIYPNPTSQYITVETDLPEKEDVEIIMTNAIGQKIYSEVLKKQWGKIQRKIDMASLPPGIYMLTVKQENRMAAKKIVKQF